MPSTCRQLLTTVNFPLYAVQCLSDRHIVVGGGGGGARTGVRNAVEIYELTNNGSTCRAELVTCYETGNEAIMNCVVYNAGRYCILFTGQGGNCQVYKIRYEVEESDININKDAGNESFITKRKNISTSFQEKTIPSVKNSGSSKNVSPPKLYFKIQPLESFQTDFSKDPYQKHLRFSIEKKWLLTGGADGHIRVYQYPKLNQLLDIKAHSDDVDDMDICPLGKRIVSVSRDGHGRIWNAENGSLITELEYVLPTNTDGNYIFRSCRFGIVDDRNDLALFGTLNPAINQKRLLKCYLCKFDPNSQFCLAKIVSTGTDMLSVMAISDNGHFIGLGNQAGGVKIYIAFSLQLVYNVDKVHGMFVTGVQFLPTSEQSRRITGGHESSLISVSVDNIIIIHHIHMRTPMEFWKLITLFILTLLIVFVIMDFFNL